MQALCFARLRLYFLQAFLTQPVRFLPFSFAHLPGFFGFGAACVVTAPLVVFVLPAVGVAVWATLPDVVVLVVVAVPGSVGVSSGIGGGTGRSIAPMSAPFAP